MGYLNELHPGLDGVSVAHATGCLFRSSMASPHVPHGFGPVWFAIPSLSASLIPFNSPVLTGTPSFGTRRRGDPQTA
jgi:hypothetical protein